MEYISSPHKKILALAGFKPLPVEAKISKAHTLPSELAGPDLNHNYLYSIILTSIFQEAGTKEPELSRWKKIWKSISRKTKRKKSKE